MKFTPKDVDAIRQAFPANVMTDLLPPWKEIPDEFKNFNRPTPQGEIVSRWFFKGLPKGTQFIPVEGVDEKKALRHIQCCMGSWEPKHEHKVAGCAYLLSIWFSEIKIPEETV